MYLFKKKRRNAESVELIMELAAEVQTFQIV